jgi:uncharacterized damage-inducible protein DinB
VDRAAIEEIFEFDDFAWRRVGQALERAGGDILGRAAPGSGWPALQDCLGHIGWGYEAWLARLNGREPAPPVVAGLDTWQKLDAYRAEQRTGVRQFLATLSDADLHADREYSLDGGVYAYTPAQLLTHLALHERGHHGDINTLFYQTGLEPPVRDFRGLIIEQRRYRVDY